MKSHRILRPTTLLLLTLGLSLLSLAGSVAGQDEVKMVGAGVKNPLILHEEKPYYTEQARKAKIEGIVLLQLVVRKDGTTDSFKVIRGLGYGLDESAITTIARKWRFKPGTFNGAPADVQILAEVTFRLYYSEEFPATEAKAEQGDVDAQMQLGKMFFEGKSVRQDFVEAYKWFDIAAANGASGAAEQRDSLVQRMTPDQVAEAQKRSAAFKQKKESKSK